MYFHSILTALAFICTFATIEFVFATIAWKGFGENIWRKLSKFLLENERHVDSVFYYSLGLSSAFKLKIFIQ